MTTRTSAIFGWAAVCISTAIACFWAFWGIIEIFHDGWWSESLAENIGLALVQYLAPMLLMLAPTAVALWHPRVGAEPARRVATRVAHQSKGGTRSMESPLWNPHSQLIDWWTATEIDARRAYRVVFNGLVTSVDKTWGPAHRGFRAVREPDEERCGYGRPGRDGPTSRSAHNPA